MSLLATPIRRVPRWVLAAFFGGLLLLGAWLVADYGVSWDEPVDRLNGLVNVRYVADLLAPAWSARQPLLQAAPTLWNYPDHDHGALLEMPLALFDVLRPGTDPRTYYLVRHATVFVVSLAGLWALFQLASLRFRDERLGLLAAGLLVLSPRFFAESFYNGKDIVFMAAFTLGAYTLARLLARPTTRRALLHGLVTAVAIDIRVLGLLLVPFTLALLGLQFWAATDQATRRSLRQTGLRYGLAAGGLMLVGWPYLWANPVKHAVIALVNMAHFRWGEFVLYRGHLVRGSRLPWHYIPVWLSITTPVAYQLAALLGLGAVIAGLRRHLRARWRSLTSQLDLLLLAWLLLPMLLVVALRSILYDGWRHLYFIYPALLLLALRGGQVLAQRARRGTGWHRLALGLGALAGAEAALTAGRMVAMHPHQQTYFSYLTSAQVERLFERDYWALSYRQGLEYLVRAHPTGPLVVEALEEPPLANNLIWLPTADQRRVVPSATAPHRYVLTTYRALPSPAPDSLGREVYALRADGVKILSIFQHD